MRRRRHTLQVSTFPFLAVLLGAMGSLIFLLLVMDRRAKLVARNKAREAHEARQAALSDADRARQDEWQRQRRELHQSLAVRDRELRGQLHAVSDDLQRSSQQIQAELDKHRQLQDLLDAEQARLTKAQASLRQRQALLLKSTQLEETSKAELARLTRDLLELEQSLDSLKRWKNQQQPTYSLVPYRGQRGAQRVPIYVECASAGLMFLPDGARLTGGDRDIALFRTEVEKRHGPLVKAQKRIDPFAPDPAAEKPYVLFLIRPTGIASFYRGQNALRGYQIDFGYELVDAEWTLTVPSQAHPTPANLHPPEVRSAVSRSPTTSPAAPHAAQHAPQHAAPHIEPLPSGQERSPVLRFETVAKSSGAGQAPANAPTGGPLTFRPAPTKSGQSLPDGPTPELKDPGQAPKGGAAASDGASAKRQPARSAPAPQLEFEEEPAPERNAMNRPATSNLASQKNVAAPPASLGRVIGNRDFVITLACYSEGVIVTPGGKSFVWSAKGDAARMDEAIVRAVSLLVTSRQATVRPGEPPYRPVLRFLVHEQGRRTYHRVYPLLENLRLPMVREDVEE